MKILNRIVYLSAGVALLGIVLLSSGCVNRGPYYQDPMAQQGYLNLMGAGLQSMRYVPQAAPMTCSRNWMARGTMPNPVVCQ
jgi:hypothetical protein